MKKNIFIVMAAGLAAAVFCGCGKAPAPAEEQAPAEAGNAAPSTVSVSTESQKEGGIRTETLKRASVQETFQAMGRVLQDAQKTHHITAGEAGTLEKIEAQLGQAVKPGETLALVKKADGGVFKVAANCTGIVTAVHAAEGDRANEMTFLFTVTEIDPLWGVLDIHERNLGQVRQGQKAEIRTAAYPDRLFKGAVAFVSPEIDAVSRTVKARVSIENPEGLLKFGMFIDASVLTGSYFQGLAVPAAAVQNGPQGPFVFVRTGETEFAARPVTTGLEKGSLVELKSGVKPGDKVAVEGAYLLKSEMMKGELGEE